MPGHIPPDVDSEEEEGDFDPPDPHDVGDDEGDGGGAAGSSRTSPTDPLERFIQKLDDLASMDGPDISAALADLPVPQRGDVPWAHHVYARGSRGMLCNILYHMLYCM